MLEVSLAVLIGGIILMATTGVFNALDRADRTLKARSEQSSQLNRLHTVMRRTFVNLAMSSRPMPRPRPASATPRPGQDSGANAAGRPATRPDPAADAPPEPPRVILTEDRRVSSTPMRKLDGPGVESSSSPATWAPQRLEVVLGRPPVPIRQGPGEHARTVFPEASAGRDDPTDERISGAKLSRGVFELQPVEPGARGPGGSPVRPITTWTLWWRPLPPGATGGASAEGSVRDHDLPPPTLIVTDLTYLRWQFFDDRVRKTEFATAYVNGLPAYVELEVQTAAGLWANWIFEVDFIMSSEEESSTPDALPGAGSGVRPVVRPPGGLQRPPASPPGGRGGGRGGGQ